MERRCAIKWFKHETDSKDSEKLKDVIAEFGYEGYGWYWRIMEIVAGKMDETRRCHYEQTVSEWCSNLKVKQKKLSLFLELIKNQFNIKLVYHEKKLRIEIPNLLKKRDDYSRKSGQKSDTLPKKSSLEVEVEVDKDKDKTHTPDPRVIWFEEDWETYPRKEGDKIKALACYLKTVTTLEKRKCFLEKMKAYVESVDEPIYLKHGETFFRNWKALVTPKPNGHSSPMAQASLGRGEFVDKVTDRAEYLFGANEDLGRPGVADLVIEEALVGEREATKLVLGNHQWID